MAHKDYYQILGVTETADGTRLKEVYRKLALKYHPDRAGDGSAAAEKMKAVNEAYAVLSNPQKRAEYDRLRRNFGSDAYGKFRNSYSEQDIYRGTDINQIFEELTRSMGLRGFDEIFKEVYRDQYRYFEINRPGLKGRGFVFGGAFGLGRNPKMGRRPGLQQGTPGKGRLSGRLLQKLLSLGTPKKGDDLNDTLQLEPELAARGGPYAYFQRQGGRKLVVKIPPGVRDGQRIRLSGMGRPGKAGGAAGDLYLRVKINTPLGRKIKEIVGGFFKG
ncbi:MAG: DnaJ domain-containing protein [Desulfobacterales bacterium]|jgi:DnaJ-class molecular chaperone